MDKVDILVKQACIQCSKNPSLPHISVLLQRILC